MQGLKREQGPNITPLTSDEVRERRSYFLTNAESRTKIYRGDRRIQGNRLCSVCHTKLSTNILATGRSEATRDHHRCYFSPLFSANLCMDSRRCQKVHKELREEQDGR